MAQNQRARPGRDHDDARVRRTRATVIAAAVELLTERGPAAFTVEAVVERTGIALTTIYRHWPSRRDLLVATIDAAGAPPGVPDSGTLRADLTTFFTARAHAQKQWDQRLRTMPGLIDAGQRDPQLSDVVQRLVSGVTEAVNQILERARDRGEIARDGDVDLMADLLLGAIFFHRAHRGAALTDAYITAVVDTVTAAFAPVSPGPRRPSAP